MKDEPLQPIPGLPWWMNTRWGRWLCTYWHPAARYWRTLWAARDHNVAVFERRRTTKELSQAVEAAIDSRYTQEARDRLLRAWINYENAQAREQDAQCRLETIG